MKRIFAIFLGLASSAASLCAATGFTYFNNGGITTAFNSGTVTGAVPVDAVNFYNSGNFTNVFTTEFPYDMSNVRYFTNRGTISGSVGFKFDTVDTALGTRRPMARFLNDNGGNISAIDNGALFFGFSTASGTLFGTSAGTASYVKIAATNLVNRGNLSVGTVGLMQLNGDTVDLSRGSLTAGQVSNGDTNFFLNNFFSGNVNRGFFIGNSYVNAFGVEDLYWGAGPDTFDLQQLAGQLNPPSVFSPEHAVQLRSSGNGVGGIFGLIQTLPTTFPADFEAFCNINEVGTNKEIQVVFLKTNFTDTSISAAVRFGFTSTPILAGSVNQFGLGAMVEFSTPEFDPITGQTITNAVYFIDSSAERNSIVLLTNALSPNSIARPSSYEITTSTPFEWLFAQPANDFYDPSLIFPGSTYKDDSVSGFYAGYAAQVGRNPEVLSGTAFNTNLFNFGFFDDRFFILPDPTNQAGRIEINANTLNVSKSRLRTEGLLSLNAKHLEGVGAADVSAGIISADLGSTNGSLVISNVFPSHFRRVRGDLFAYSAIWNNTETNDTTTNAVHFHILILDHDLKADFKPTIRDLTLRSTNLIIKDDLTISRSYRFFAENLTFDGTNTLTEDAANLHAANLVGVKNFVNETDAVFQGANDAFFGWDTEQGFDSIINRGTISANAPLFKSEDFQNSGVITALNGGSIIIQADTADLSNGTLTPDRDLTISVGNLIATNSIITAGGLDPLGNLQLGRLVLDVTNFITDLGTNANNVWQVSDGFLMERKPFEGDLLGTEIHTIASVNHQSEHVWAGQDVGPQPGGFFNNVALGHLILDVQSSNSTLHFSGADFENALYVVNLDFNVGTNVDVNASFNDLLKIDDNMRIYFINSNAGDKLTNAFPDRVIQVESFDFDQVIGPLSASAKSLLSDQLPARYQGIAQLSVTADGFGTVTPNLDGKILRIGHDYQMKAKPGSGQVFKGWSGGINSQSSTLKFEMSRDLGLHAEFIPNPFDDSANPVSGNYNGLFSDTNDVQHESTGFFNLKLTKKGAFSGRIISGKTYPFRGSFDASGHQQVFVHRARQSNLTLDLQLDLSNHTDQITGTVSGGNWVADLTADRAKAGAMPVAETGKYTLVIPGGAAPGPVGDGFGTVVVNGDGSLHFKGTLADGTHVNQKVNISKDGAWPFYAALYHGTGSAFSWLTFTNDPVNSLVGDLTWFKKPVPGRNYPDGFTNTTSVIGSPYTAAEPVLEIADGTVTLSGGHLSDSLTNAFTLSSNNVVTTTGTNGLKIKISLPAGLLNGTFLHPDTQKTTVFRGVVLQQQNNARGFFLDADKSGAVILK